MRHFDRLVEEMNARVDSLAEAMLERLGERSPGWDAESAFSRRQVLAAARASIRSQLRAFRFDELPEVCPPDDAAAARAVARVGELRLFATGYRVAQMVLWEAWFGLVEDSTDPDLPERRRLLARGFGFFFRYAELLGDQVAVVYGEERARLAAGNAQRRFRAVKAILDGDLLAAPPADLRLDLEQHHLGLLAWGAGGAEAARGLAAKLVRPLFMVSPLEHLWWGWISGKKPFETSEERAVGLIELPAGTGLAIGLQEFGPRGFRATHRQAQRARLLAPSAGPFPTLYSDVAVEALATENPDEARNFVVRELGAIGDDSATSRRIRETLIAYFAAEYNAASAAASLGVHQQTVANRLRAAEARLGHSIGSRRVEIEVALRLRAALTRPDS